MSASPFNRMNMPMKKIFLALARIIMKQKPFSVPASRSDVRWC